MIFPNLEVESILQTADKTRLSGVKSYISKDEAAITLVEIEPEAGNGYVIVTGTKSADWFLDWEYSTDGVKTVSLLITTDGVPTVKTATITVVSSVDDNLFSKDADLVQHETDILKWVPQGRNSFLNIHRRAQDIIIAHLDEIGLRDTSGNKLTKEAVLDLSEVKEWSTYLTLRLIMENQSNSLGDVFNVKASQYKSKEIEARSRAYLRLDYDGSGVISSGESYYIRSVGAIRR